MTKGSPSKPAIPAAAGKNETQASSKAIKKERSLRSLFSFFKSSRHDKKTLRLPDFPYPNNKPAAKTLGLSTASLPAQSTTEEDSENSDNDSPQTAGRWHSTTSLPSQVRPPFARHSPTSSSSSASSFEFPSGASTTATSPSNSSPSVLIKSLSSASIVTMNSTTSAISSPQAEQYSSPNQIPPKPLETSKSSKRVPDGYQKQPSPLSSVMDAHSPYIFPISPMPTYENQPRRRTSLGNFLLRRSQSHPDLADLTQEDLPPLPPMPASAPPSRPTSASSISRLKTFRRRSGDPHGIGGYTDQEKIERISILGADPAGYGYYLYPTSQKETSNNQRNNGMRPPNGKRGRPGYVDDWKKGGSGSDGVGASRGGGGSGMPSGGRAWKDSRGRSFRKTVAQQAIPEEAGDAFDLENMISQPTGPNRRHSEGYALGSDYQRKHLVSTVPVPSIPATLISKKGLPQEKERRQSLHNNWDSIQTQKQIQELSSLKVPSIETSVPHDWDRDDQAVLRRLQQGAQRAIDAADSAAEGFDGKRINFSRPNTAGSGEQTKVVEKDNLPMIRIDMIEA